MVCRGPSTHHRHRISHLHVGRRMGARAPRWRAHRRGGCRRRARDPPSSAPGNLRNPPGMGRGHPNVSGAVGPRSHFAGATSARVPLVDSSGAAALLALCLLWPALAPHIITGRTASRRSTLLLPTLCVLATALVIAPVLASRVTWQRSPGWRADVRKQRSTLDAAKAILRSLRAGDPAVRSLGLRGTGAPPCCSAARWPPFRIWARPAFASWARTRAAFSTPSPRAP